MQGYWPGPYYALRTLGYKYIEWRAGYELYNLQTDPWEVNNIFETAPRVRAARRLVPLRRAAPANAAFCVEASRPHSLPRALVYGVAPATAPDFPWLRLLLYGSCVETFAPLPLRPAVAAGAAASHAAAAENLSRGELPLPRHAQRLLRTDQAGMTPMAGGLPYRPSWPRHSATPIAQQLPQAPTLHCKVACRELTRSLGETLQAARPAFNLLSLPDFKEWNELANCPHRHPVISCSLSNTSLPHIPVPASFPCSHTRNK